VFGAVDFLRAYHLGKEINVGKHVTVVGGGITSVDAARTAVRLGAKKVTLYFRHDSSDIPGQEWEVDAAAEEGVQIVYRTAPVRVVTQYGKVRGLELTEMRLDQYDSIGRRHPKPILGSEFTEKAETVLFDAARDADLGFLPEGAGIEINEGAVKVDENLRTTHAKVWAGGDMVTGPAAVIDAINAGLIAAAAIDVAVRAAHGQAPWTAPAEEMFEIPLKAGEAPGDQPRRPMPKAPPGIRRSDFREVELGYTLDMALAEACRCLRCDADA
jgi:NADH-quinone oxidoreductase subunit F